MFVGGKLAENMYVSTPNKHGFSFSTSSYTSVTPHSNNCKDLNSSISTPSFTTSSSSFKLSSPNKPSINRKPPPGAIRPAPHLTGETQTLTASNTTTSNQTNNNHNRNKFKKNNNNNNTTTKTTETTKTPTTNTKISIKSISPPVTLLSSTTAPSNITMSQKLKPSASNDNFCKIKNNLQKNSNLTQSKSHNEIATTKTQTNKITMKPPLPTTAHKTKLKKSNSSCTPSTSSNKFHKSSESNTPSTSTSNSNTKQNNYSNNSKTLPNHKRNSGGGGNTNANVNTLKRKFEITEVRLNSTTNPHALVDGTTYTVTDQTNRCVYHL